MPMAVIPSYPTGPPTDTNEWLTGRQLDCLVGDGLASKTDDGRYALVMPA